MYTTGGTDEEKGWGSVRVVQPLHARRTNGGYSLSRAPPPDHASRGRRLLSILRSYVLEWKQCTRPGQGFRVQDLGVRAQGAWCRDMHGFVVEGCANTHVWGSIGLPCGGSHARIQESRGGCKRKAARTTASFPPAATPTPARALHAVRFMA